AFMRMLEGGRFSLFAGYAWLVGGLFLLWTLVDEKYKVGQLVKGTITKVVDFGAFARIEPGLEGLIHSSELAEGGEAVKVGDEVTLCIVSIDSAHRRMGLSLRQARLEEAARGGAEMEALAEEEAIGGEAAMEDAAQEEALQPPASEAAWSDLAEETAEP
ncbi:MAG TPA: S1 RNA-binding domain-containing protein, partial [Anaerolineae bacterium]|nr:S1 RNA-binding domain-containing protein [Anaerolineae bacterium]